MVSGPSNVYGINPKQTIVEKLKRKQSFKDERPHHNVTCMKIKMLTANEIASAAVHDLSRKM